MKSWVSPVVFVLAIVTILVTANMAVSELMPATIDPGPMSPGLSPVRSYDFMQAVGKVGDDICKGFFHGESLHDVMTKPIHDEIPGKVNSYILYSVFLFGSMAVAAIAINAIGRWDSEEKTVIPFKK